MSSKPHSKPRLLELDLPTTEEDIEALRRARQTSRPSLAETLRILSRQDTSPQRYLSRRLAVGWVPFTLD